MQSTMEYYRAYALYYWILLKGGTCLPDNAYYMNYLVL
jgi:hypothetical protein